MDITNTSAQYIKGVGPDRLKMLKRLGISTVRDCLWHLPRRYEDRSNFLPISGLKADEFATVKATVADSKIFTTRTGITIFQLTVSDATGKFFCMWFRQPYMKKYFQLNDTVILYGKVMKSPRLSMVHPEYEIIRSDDPDGETIHTSRIVPVYPLVSGINQRILRRIIYQCCQQYGSYINDFLATNIRARHRLLDLRSAIANIHFPVNQRQKDEARRRLVFDEFFIMQLALALRRYKMKYQPQGKAHATEGELQDEFFKNLPFELTKSQKKVIDEIRHDMSLAQPMHRLVQGEVGSGKTVISAYALILTVANQHQGVLMVPTEILARQHYITLTSLFSSLGISVTLLINGLKKAEKEEALRSIESGEADIIIGTHALIQEAVNFKDIGLVVIDEQHKFGVEQRSFLKSKTENPHILVMSATPIPRTLAMTLYGDMDISVVSELPQGKRDVKTVWVNSSHRGKVYDFIKEQLKLKHQAYIVYPVIEESRALGSSGAARMYEELKEEVFKGFNLGLLHGRMSEDEKIQEMKNFKKGKTDILVATTVIEVGIDVPNAAVMLIENAERFGLSQLHQLRGRVGRGKSKSWCILVSDADTEQARQRLEAVTETDDGFKIAQADMDIRGPGELFGKKQHGLPSLALGDLANDVALLEEARKEAFDLIAVDPALKDQSHKGIRETLVSVYKDKFHLGLMG